MRAIILAAGRGSRLKHLTDEKPKCMVSLHGKPLIEHQINSLQAAGISQIAVVTGYQQDKIQAKGISQRFHNPHWQTSNMVRSLMAAHPWLSTADCIISYGDIFYQPSAISQLINDKTPIAITYDTNYLENWSKRFDHPLDDLESFKLNNMNQLTEIGQKPNSLNDVQGQYMGLIKITPPGWQLISCLLKSFTDDKINKLDMTSLLNLAIKQKHPIHAIAHSDVWGEVDHESDLKLYELIT